MSVFSLLTGKNTGSFCLLSQDLKTHVDSAEENFALDVSMSLLFQDECRIWFVNQVTCIVDFTGSFS